MLTPEIYRNVAIVALLLFAGYIVFYCRYRPTRSELFFQCYQEFIRIRTNIFKCNNREQLSAMELVINQYRNKYHQVDADFANLYGNELKRTIDYMYDLLDTMDQIFFSTV